jgi:Phosphoesterase family
VRFFRPLVYLWLCDDHTSGISVGFPTPAAQVADNDLAVGRVVEAISHSPYWKDSAIFVTEDDAQDGVDHVDGHRTEGLVISPFVKRNVVDSTYYNQFSIIRTVEQILGVTSDEPTRPGYPTDARLVHEYTELRDLHCAEE